MNRKLSFFCALLLALVMMIPTFASDLEISSPGNNTSIPIKLDAEAAVFSVTVPTSLPIDVAPDGTVTVATDAKIINNGVGAVVVTDVSITGIGDWEIVDYEIDMSKEQVNVTKIGMSIMGDKTTSEGFVFNQSNWPSISGSTDSDNSDELVIGYDAKLPAQSEDISKTSICTITFTIGWDTNKTT